MGAPSNIEVGDVIGVSRQVLGFPYEHYGIYVGENQVIHFYKDNESAWKKKQIELTNFREFLGNTNEFFKLEFDENSFVPAKSSKMTFSGMLVAPWIIDRLVAASRMRVFSKNETVARAWQAYRAQNEKYNLFFNNCEHFVMWCKTGNKESNQSILKYFPNKRTALLYLM